MLEVVVVVLLLCSCVSVAAAEVRLLGCNTVLLSQLPCPVTTAMHHSRAADVDDAAAPCHQGRQRLTDSLGAQEVGGQGGLCLIRPKGVALVRDACQSRHTRGTQGTGRRQHHGRSFGLARRWPQGRAVYKG